MVRQIFGTCRLKITRRKPTNSKPNWHKLKISKSDKTYSTSFHSGFEFLPPRPSDIVSPFCLHASLFLQIESQKMSNFRPRTNFKKWALLNNLWVEIGDFSVLCLASSKGCSCSTAPALGGQSHASRFAWCHGPGKPCARC